jgi:hypothetical protein
VDFIVSEYGLSVAAGSARAVDFGAVCLGAPGGGKPRGAGRGAMRGSARGSGRADGSALTKGTVAGGGGGTSVHASPVAEAVGCIAVTPISGGVGA